MRTEGTIDPERKALGEVGMLGRERWEEVHRRAAAGEHRATIRALRSTARRSLLLEAEAADLESQLEELVRKIAPALLDEAGVGVLSAAELLCAWSHRGRLRSEAAFAKLAGAAPLPASSG